MQPVPEEMQGVWYISLASFERLSFDEAAPGSPENLQALFTGLREIEEELGETAKQPLLEIDGFLKSMQVSVEADCVYLPSEDGAIRCTTVGFAVAEKADEGRLFLASDEPEEASYLLYTNGQLVLAGRQTGLPYDLLFQRQPVDIFALYHAIPSP